ncbi:DUF7556 family protein [Halostella pelagica]|uniref:DUF7556 family protein n=1 Tax=Halostella pelagica TaxID=2583824 RepID=UPI00192A40DA|nr:hypothetical protein [Halostella pelagica]
MASEMESVMRRGGENGDVMAAIDEIEGRPHLVIADVARDDAWISTAETASVSLGDWR